MSYNKIAVQSCVMASLALFPLYANATQFSPYIVGGEGEYAVISSSANQVISSGNIFDELLKDATISARLDFLAERHDIGATYLDPEHNRLFMFTGARDGYGDYGVGDGVLVLRMSDRSFITYIKQHWNRWGGDEMFVSDKNQIFLQGGKGMLVYNGITYKRDHKDITMEYSNRESCFVPKTNMVYDDQYGFYSLDKYVQVEGFNRIDNYLSRGQISLVAAEEAYQVDCRNGRLLLMEQDVLVKPGDVRKMMVYDLKTDKVISKFFPAGVEGWSSQYWQLSRDGEYAVWNSLLNIKTKYGSDASVHDGHVIISNAASGQMVGEFRLPAKTDEELQLFDDYNFKDYSADNKKMLFYSKPYLYVVDIQKAKVTNKIETPFIPGWYNSTGFVVWP